tara:strand:- start:1040 stop:2938 length:1899 start_codon:yes stop_codon:yes gene_type:complete
MNVECCPNCKSIKPPISVANRSSVGPSLQSALSPVVPFKETSKPTSDVNAFNRTFQDFNNFEMKELDTTRDYSDIKDVVTQKDDWNNEQKASSKKTETSVAKNATSTKESTTLKEGTSAKEASAAKQTSTAKEASAAKEASVAKQSLTAKDATASKDISVAAKSGSSAKEAINSKTATNQSILSSSVDSSKLQSVKDSKVSQNGVQNNNDSMKQANLSDSKQIQVKSGDRSISNGVTIGKDSQASNLAKNSNTINSSNTAKSAESAIASKGSQASTAFVATNSSGNTVQSSAFSNGNSIVTNINTNLGGSQSAGLVGSTGVLSMKPSDDASLIAAKNVAQSKSGATQLQKNDATSSAAKSVSQATTSLSEMLPSSNGVNAGISTLSQMTSTVQQAQVSLNFSLTAINLANIHPQAGANAAKAVGQLSPANLGAFTGLMGATASLSNSLNPMGTVLLSAVLSNVAGKLSPEVMSALGTVLKDLASMGVLEKIVNDANKMASLQALLSSNDKLDTTKLLQVLGPFIKQAVGNDVEEKKLSLEKHEAFERLREFLDTYVSTGHGIWAEQMNLNKEKAAREAEFSKAKQQLNRQVVMMKKYDNQQQNDDVDESFLESIHDYNSESLHRASAGLVGA